jgi:hypothetical protein
MESEEAFLILLIFLLHFLSHLRKYLFESFTVHMYVTSLNGRQA